MAVSNATTTPPPAFFTRPSLLLWRIQIPVAPSRLTRWSRSLPPPLYQVSVIHATLRPSEEKASARDSVFGWSEWALIRKSLTAYIFINWFYFLIVTAFVHFRADTTIVTVKVCCTITWETRHSASCCVADSIDWRGPASNVPSIRTKCLPG